MLLRQPNIVRRHSQRAAFTLMEIIVVVAIILILAGAGVFVFTGVLADQSVNRAKMDVRNIEAAIQTFFTTNHRYPSSLDELVNRQPNGSAALLKVEALTDPWGQPYHYDQGRLNSRTDIPLVSSQGPPGKNQPIQNWYE
jgi:general secretion pathway protein G